MERRKQVLVSSARKRKTDAISEEKKPAPVNSNICKQDDTFIKRQQDRQTVTSQVKVQRWPVLNMIVGGLMTSLYFHPEAKEQICLILLMQDHSQTTQKIHPKAKLHRC